MAKEIPAYYPNMIKLFQECPMKFYFKYIEQLSTPLLDKGFQTGKNIHSLASYYLNGVDITKFEKVLSEKEKPMWEILKKKPYFNYEILGVEKNILSKMNGYGIGGRIDAIVKDKGNIFVLDYKTGGVKDDMTYDLQTMIYLILCGNLIKEYDGMYFIYLDLKEDKEISIRYTKELREEYEKKLTDIIRNIENFSPKNFNKKTECKCEYSQLCH